MAPGWGMRVAEHRRGERSRAAHTCIDGGANERRGACGKDTWKADRGKDICAGERRGVKALFRGAGLSYAGPKVAAERFGISVEVGGKCPSTAQADANSAGVVRGLKPPPPSESSSSAGYTGSAVTVSGTHHR